MAIENVTSTITVDNPPASVSLIDSVDATDLSLRGLIAGTGVTLGLDTSGGDSRIIISSPLATAQNVGSGIAFYKGPSATPMQFRTMIAGDNVVLTQQNDTIRVNVSNSLSASNRGTLGAEVFAARINDELQFRRLRAGDNVTLAVTSDAITVSAQTGQSNTGISMGHVGDGGFEIYAGMDGDKLRFKKLFAGPNIRLLDNGCGIMIAAALPTTSGGSYMAGINLGSGAPFYAGRDDTLLRFRSLVGTGGVTVTQTENEIVIDTSASSGTATNVGSGSGLFRNKNGSNLEFRSLVAGDFVTLTLGDNEVVIDVDAVLGEPSSGSYADSLTPGAPAPAFPGWTASTKIADALDQLNKLLGTIVNA